MTLVLGFAAAISALVGTAATDHSSELSPAAKQILQRHWTLDAKALVALFSHGQDLRKVLAAELDGPVPSWPRIQALLSEIRRNDANTREESKRLEIKLLNELSPEDRLVYLRSVYSLNESGPPPTIRMVEPPHK